MQEKTDKKEINAFVDSWGLKEVSLNGESLLKANIKFLDKDGNAFYMDKFLLKKDGTPNKNTVSAIRACGFTSNDFRDFVEPNALTKGKEVSITITKNDKGYVNVEFVNALGSFKGVMASEDARQKLGGAKLAVLNTALSAIPATDDDDLPF